MNKKPSIPKFVSVVLFNFLIFSNELLLSDYFSIILLVAFNNLKKKPYYAKRREELKQIPRFWATAIRGASDYLDTYMTFEDIDLLLSIKDLHIEWDDEMNPYNYTLEIHFEPNDYLDDTSLVLKKNFRYIKKGNTSMRTSKKEDDETADQDGDLDIEDGDEADNELIKLQQLLEKEEEKNDKGYVSDPVAIKWKKGKNLTKRPETGANSFFNFFNFVGEGPGDYPEGESLATFVQEELFPQAHKFYFDGLLDQIDGEGEFDLDEDEEDEEDIGDDDEDEVKGKKNKKEADDNDGPSKKKAKNT